MIHHSKPVHNNSDLPQNRISSSSDELINTSDELNESPININRVQITEYDRGRDRSSDNRRGREDRDEPQSHSSRAYRPNELTPQEIVEQQAAEIVKQAEKAKARILEVPGKDILHISDKPGVQNRLAVYCTQYWLMRSILP